MLQHRALTGEGSVCVPVVLGSQLLLHASAILALRAP